MSLNYNSDEYWAEKLRRENCDQFNTLVRMHLSFVLDLNTDDNDCIAEKIKLKKWSFVPFTKKPKCATRGVMYGAPLTQEGICQVYQLIEYLGKEPNICIEGIFRRTGSLARQQELRSLLNQGAVLELDGGRYSVHDCASVLKGFLAELPEPLLTEAQYQAYCQISELSGPDKVSNETRLLRALQLLLLLLPSENRVLLKDVLQLLNKTASYESKNKMSANSLATLFTPHLLCPRKLSPEALHVDSQTLCGIVAFMISKEASIFRIPPKLAVDIKAYFTGREKRKILSPNKELDESVSDNLAANTVFSFVDHERTAQAHMTNPTEAALAQLYAYIQSLPESSKKRKLVKQFNKENGNGTPLQVARNHKSTPLGKSFGDSIKKHIFQKGLNKTVKRSVAAQLSQMRSSSEEVLNHACRLLLAMCCMLAVIFQSPNCVPFGARTKLFCVDCESSSDSDNEQLDGNRENKSKEVSPKLNRSDVDEKLMESLKEFSVKRCSSSIIGSDMSQGLARCYSEPDLSSDTGERYWASYLTSTPAVLPLLSHREVNFTPAGQDRKSMSPITRSTQRMSKAMQESMMTPRSRKPVLLMSGTNICNLPKMDVMQSNSISDLQEETENSISFTPIPIVKSKSEGDLLQNTKRCTSTYSEPADSLTSTFQEYLHSRSLLIQTPEDSSFSSRTDDYDSANEDISMMSEGKLSESLLYCLNGNYPSSLENSLIDNKENCMRKRTIQNNDTYKPKKYIVEKKLILKPKQFNEEGEPIVFETSF